ncbi:MAG TPA: hypothetical protein VMU83_19940, partial [Hanamia sp.]|nr:hypothetical protein [Hanamia sp.]
TGAQAIFNNRQQKRYRGREQGTECYRVTFSQCPKANTKHIKPLRHQDSLLKKVTICFQFFLLKRLKQKV